ncbi:MAG: DUF1499 domain-containing protein [Paracoccaceae bacterium]
MLTYLALAALLGAAAFIRFAPADPAYWHVDPGATPRTDCLRLATLRASTRVSCLRPEDPVKLLTNLDEIALTTPRTTRFAGSAETGRITWVSRSLILGFPDFTTAQATTTPEGTQLDLHARPRFGDYDWGVNPRRLAAWLSELPTP